MSKNKFTNDDVKGSGSFKKFTKEEFKTFTKNVMVLKSAVENEIDYIKEISASIVDHDPHLANLYIKQAETTKAILDHIKFRREGN